VIAGGLALLLLAMLAWGGPAVAETTLKLPPPELSGLVPLAALPADKPPVPIPAVSAPPVPVGLPELPATRHRSDPTQRPVAPMPSPRLLACNPVGTVFKVASELVECGRARYQRGELEAARTAFQTATQESSDRDLLREARYWLGETLLRLGRAGEVERTLEPVARDDPRGDFGMFATHTMGWVALDLNEPARALPRFDALLKGRMPVVLIPHARHGRALALYGLKRYPEARDEWTALLGQPSGAPRPLIADATFWLGDTLGRLGDYKGATSRLTAFTTGGSSAMMDPGLLSLGWWSRAAGQPADAVKAYRSYLAAYSQMPSAVWARAGLAQALLDQGEFNAARDEAKQIGSLDKSGALALPTALALRRWIAEKGKAEDARALDSELVAMTLEPGVRAWVLLLSGDLARRSGNAGEARDLLEVVRAAPAAPPVKQQAELSIAQLDFAAREFAQSQTTAETLLSQPLAEDARAAALVLSAEAAYWAKRYDAAVAAYTRFLSDFSSRPEVPAVGFALGWAEFRRDKLDAARERWAAFATEAPSDPNAALALLLAAELAAKAGDQGEARALLDRVAGQYPGTEQAEVARLNRAILAVNAGRSADALAELGRIGPRGASSPALGRARVVKGLALIVGKRGPAAEPDLRAALGQGDDAIAHLGLGVVAFERAQWDAAAREFTEARDGGWGKIASAAEYGLAATAFNQGKAADFKKIATELLAGPNDAGTPSLLLGMEAVAVEEKRWPEARTAVVRLVDQFPRHEATPGALASLGAAAGENGEWPLAREMYQTLATRYPATPARQGGRLVLGEALLRTGAPADARRELEAFVASAAPGDSRRGRALSLLGEAQVAAGDKSGAAQTYTRFASEYPGGKEAPNALLGAGRLLQTEGKWDQAKPLLDRAVKDGDSAIAAEAAFELGEGLRAAGEHEQAAEAYMTAAYVAPDSVWARRALLGAGRSFEAAKQNGAAVIVYKKLLASSSVEPDLAAAARSGLKSLGAN